MIATNLRTFQRKFRGLRQQADAGEEIVIRARGQDAYVFRAIKPKSSLLGCAEGMVLSDDLPFSTGAKWAAAP